MNARYIEESCYYVFLNKSSRDNFLLRNTKPEESNIGPFVAIVNNLKTLEAA
jgi:hypothetical protein